MTDTAYALAAMRAAGAQPRPDGTAELEALRSAAGRAGRRLVDLTGGQLTLGWLEGSEPVAGPDSGVERDRPVSWTLLVFAAALRAAWNDKEEHPYPGRPVPVTQVLAAVQAMGTLSGSNLDDGVGVARHQKGALPRLLDAGFLVAADDDRVRLGPRVAAWTEREVDTLRHLYEQMPTEPAAGDA